MVSSAKSRIPEIVRKHADSLIEEWIKGQLAGGRINEAELRQQCRTFLGQLLEGTEAGGDFEDVSGQAWDGMRELLAEVSESRSLKGFSPSETATFVFSFKRPFFTRLRRELAKDSDVLAEETWRATTLLDQLGLFTTEAYQTTREAVINRQQQEMLELSTPVVKLWDGILALPIIGTLDSARTQVVMETLLQTIVAHSAEIAIIDITGVPTVDTLVAQHLIKTVTAARLMGADCIISGIRPQIAQTIVHLGVDLTGVTTKATMADALSLALKRRGLSVSRAAAAAK
ncbi:STAS domain-containing protein [Isosphaeraceae bacterium EP7]